MPKTSLMGKQDADSRPSGEEQQPAVHSEGDLIIGKVNGNTVEGDWQCIKRFAEELLSEVDNHKTDLKKAKEIGSGVHICISCENCGIEHEAEYARNLTETPEEHVDYPDNDCSLEHITVEAFCPRHGTVPLEYDECDTCASNRGLMNR